jgi:hypothetical protein
MFRLCNNLISEKKKGQNLTSQCCSLNLISSQLHRDSRSVNFSAKAFTKCMLNVPECNCRVTVSHTVMRVNSTPERSQDTTFPLPPRYTGLPCLRALSDLAVSRDISQRPRISDSPDLALAPRRRSVDPSPTLQAHATSQHLHNFLIEGVTLIRNTPW